MIKVSKPNTSSGSKKRANPVTNDMMKCTVIVYTITLALVYVKPDLLFAVKHVAAHYLIIDSF